MAHVCSYGVVKWVHIGIFRSYQPNPLTTTIGSEVATQLQTFLVVGKLYFILTTKGGGGKGEVNK